MYLFSFIIRQIHPKVSKSRWEGQETPVTQPSVAGARDAVR